MKDYRFGKLLILVNAMVPLAMMSYDVWQGRVADWVAFVIQTSGMLSLIFLMLSLAVTPARRITSLNWLGHYRKMLGLIAFFYICLHFASYFLLKQRLNVYAAIADTFEHKFIFFGMSCFILLIPLAVTSTSGMVKRLGAKRWRLLHRLVYVAGVLAVLHYLGFAKVAENLPRAFAAVLVMLLGIRVVYYLADRSARAKSDNRGRIAA